MELEKNLPWLLIASSLSFAEISHSPLEPVTWHQQHQAEPEPSVNRPASSGIEIPILLHMLGVLNYLAAHIF